MIPLSVPNLTGNEKKYLENCIDTTYVSSVGEYVNRFEEIVSKVAGSSYGVATSAGTTGLHVALTAVGVKHGDLVIIPTFTFIASANAVAHCGAEPWCMDIRDSDWCLDPELVCCEIEEKCEQKDGQLIHRTTGRRIAALMPVYTLGNIPDMLAFRSIAERYSIPLVADAACAIGAEYGHQPLGDLADLSVFSFNGNKTVTCGGGGAVVGNDPAFMTLVRHLTTTARVWPDYDFDRVGFNYRMTNIQAAVGVAQMERLSLFVKAKRYIREYYGRKLENCGVSFFPTTEGSSCWLSGIVLPKGGTLERTKALCFQLKEAGIEAHPFWKPVHLQAPYASAPKSQMSVAENLWERVVTLPCSTGITEEELAFVVKNVILQQRYV